MRVLRGPAHPIDLWIGGGEAALLPSTLTSTYCFGVAREGDVHRPGAAGGAARSARWSPPLATASP